MIGSPSICWIHIIGSPLASSEIAVIETDRNSLCSFKKLKFILDKPNCNDSVSFEDISSGLFDLLDRKIWAGYGLAESKVREYFDSIDFTPPRCLHMIDFRKIVVDHFEYKQYGTDIRGMMKYFQIGEPKDDALCDLKAILRICKRVSMTHFIENAEPQSGFTLKSPAAREDDICWFDLETTGRPEKIIEIGIIVCNRKTWNFKKDQEYRTLVYSDTVDEITEKITGIKAEDLEDAPKFEDIARDVRRRLSNKIWAGHNMKSFDSRVTTSNFMETKNSKSKVEGFFKPPKPLNDLIVDTLKLTQAHFANRAGRNSMEALMEYFELGREDHRALSDIKNTFRVFKRISLLTMIENAESQIGFVTKFPPLLVKKQSTEKKIAIDPTAMISSEKLYRVVDDATQETQEKFLKFFRNQLERRNSQGQGGFTTIDCYIRYNNGSQDRRVFNVSISRDGKNFYAIDEHGQNKSFLVKKVLEFSDVPIQKEDTRPKIKKRTPKSG